MRILNSAGQSIEDQSVGDLKRYLEERFNKIEQRFDMIDQKFSLMNSRIRDLENDIRDISSIKGAVGRIGFQEIPYEMNGRSAVEQIKDYY